MIESDVLYGTKCLVKHLDPFLIEPSSSRHTIESHVSILFLFICSHILHIETSRIEGDPC